MRFITSKKEYQSVYESCIRFNGRFFLLLLKIKSEEAISDEFPLSNGNQLFVGIVVSKKVGNAVKRNKVKRRIRAFFRENKFALNRKIVIIAKPVSAQSDWLEIKTDLSALIKQIKT